MWRQTVQRLIPLGSAVTQQVQRNIGISAVVSQKAASLDPVQQLFVDKIREYRTKSTGGKLVDANAETEAQLKEMLGNLERAFQATGVDMTQFPSFNFIEPDLVWPGLTDEQASKIQESALAADKADADARKKVREEEKYNPFEGFE